MCLCEKMGNFVGLYNVYVYPPAMSIKFFLRRFLPAIFVFGALSALTAPTAVAADIRPHLIDSLERRLMSLESSADSVATLFDIYDLSRAEQASSALGNLFNAAKNSGDTTAQIEAIKYQALISSQDTLYLQRLKKAVSKYDVSPKVRETRLLIDLLLTENRIEADTAKHTSQDISAMIREYTVNPADDPYDRIAQLYTLCTYLSQATSGDLLEANLQKLVRLVDRTPLTEGEVRKLIYKTAVPTYTVNNSPELAVETSKKVLNIIDSLNTANRAEGRKFCSRDRERFTCYRRLFTNYKALTPAEIEQYYRNAIKLAERNADIESDMKENPIIVAHYNMSKGNYATAIPLLKRALNADINSRYRLSLYSGLYDAAVAVGDKASQLEAAAAMIKHSRRTADGKMLERAREVEIVRDLNELQDLEYQEEREHHETKIDTYRFVVSLCALLAIVLVALIVIGVLRFLHLRRTTNELRSGIRKVCDDRAALRKQLEDCKYEIEKARQADKVKTDFINNMCHEVKTPLGVITEYTQLIVDCIPEDKRVYLDRFANIVDLNAKLVLTIMNDVLDMAALEHGTMTITVAPTSVRNICMQALDTVFENEHASKPDIQVKFNTTGSDDIILSTDSQRVVQILINLLTNAEKFTEKGSITLDYGLSKDGKTVDFTVTDTGQGIPNGKEEEIFNRFRQLDSSASGCGLGLYISRLISRLLGADLRVDSTYHKGARFILSIPVK